MRRIPHAACLALASFTLWVAPFPLRAQPGMPPNDPDSWKVAGTAKVLCSALFVSGRDSAEARAHVADYFLREKLDSLTTIHVDRQRKLVRLTLAGRITREAKLYGDQGCVIHQPGRDSVFFRPVRVTSRLPDAATTPWPMGDLLPNQPLPAGLDTAKLRQATDSAFANPAGLTAGFVVVHRGRIVAERYANGAHPRMQLESWSMGKSITGTLIGMLVHQGAFRLDDPAPVPEWRKTPGDPRARIRVIDLLRMSSGLRFSRGSPEDLPGYHDHDLIYTGAIDAFQFAVTREPQFAPNSFGRYRNVDVMTLGLLIRDAVRNRGENYLTWPQRALFDKIGIRRQVLETDPYGNFLLSGYDYGTPRNWARIGMLYLNDGVWNGERLLPEGWTRLVSTPAPAWADSSYGGMVWVNARGVWPLPRDAFAFRGAGGQETYVVPSLDLVVVRMGHFPGSRAGSQDLRRALALIAEAVAPAASQRAGYFPPRGEWARRPPAEVGLNPALVDSAIAFAKASESNAPRDLEKAHWESAFGREPLPEPLGPFKPRGELTGIVVRNGYIVAEWGEPDRVDLTFSVTKSFLSSTAGLAWDRKLIPDVHARVKDLVKTGEFDSPHNAKITWDHLLRQTSDWEGTLWSKPDWSDRPPANTPIEEYKKRVRNEPGTSYKYNDVRVNTLGLALLRIWKRPLPEVLREFVMDPIGASKTWEWHGYRNSTVEIEGRPMLSVGGGAHWGGGMWISARDQARFGLLTLNRGRWGDRRILSEAWIAQALTPTGPQPTYGFMNYFLNTGRRQWPSAPESTFCHLGNGTNAVCVLPDYDMVVVLRWIRGNAVDGVLKRLIEAAGSPAAPPQQPAAGPVTRTDLLRQALPPGDFRNVQAAVIELAPGAQAPRHRHDVAVVAYVLEGTVENRFDGGSPQTHKAGESWWEAPGTVHDLARNASSTARARLLVVYVGEEGKAPTVPLQGTGPALREGYLDAGGVRLFYRLAGTGPDTLVVLHGGPGLTLDYLADDLLPLAERHTLIFYDQRGTGRSSLVRDSTALDGQRFAEDLEAVRRHFKLERVALLGHSWGAGVAALYAGRYPERISRLIIVGGIPLQRPLLTSAFDALAASRDSVTRRQMQQWREARLANPGDAAACRAYYVLWFTPFFVDAAAARRSKGDFCAGSPESLRNKMQSVDRFTMASLGEWDWRGSVRGLKAPVLVIHGSRDVLPLDGARGWASVAPNARLLLLEGVGHFPYLEAPERFFTAVHEFLEGRWPVGARRD